MKSDTYDSDSVYDFTKFSVGDIVHLNGTIFSARDKAHLFLINNDFENEKLRKGIIYHCGPIIKDDNVVAAGPTTSSRMNPYTPKVIEKYDIRGIIGKGGMNNNVLEAMKGRCVYFSTVGGAALVYAKHMKVKNVYLKEYGMPEAIWEFEVKDFPVMVAMDSKGNSIYDYILKKSKSIHDDILH